MSDWINRKLTEQRDKEAKARRDATGRQNAAAMHETMLSTLKEQVNVDVAAYCQGVRNQAGAVVADKDDGGFIVTCGPRTATVNKGEENAITWVCESGTIGKGTARGGVKVAPDAQGHVRFQKPNNQFLDVGDVSRVILEPVLFGETSQ